MTKISENKKFDIKNSIVYSEQFTKYETGRKVQKVYIRISIVIISGNLNFRFFAFCVLLAYLNFPVFCRNHVKLA